MGNQKGRFTTNMGGTILWARVSGCIQSKDGERELSISIDFSLLPDYRHTVTCFLTLLPSCLPNINLPPSSCFCQVFATAKREKKLIHMVSKILIMWIVYYSGSYQKRRKTVKGEYWERLSIRYYII